MNYAQWMLQTIRDEKVLESWLEEFRFEIYPLFQKVLQNIENGTTILILSDSDRKWFGEYIMSSINNQLDRPLFPFMKFESILHNSALLGSSDNMSLVNDMLSIAFPNGYIFWYTGKSDTKMASLAKNMDNSFMWLIDKEIAGSIYFASTDKLLDIKLIQLFKLFDKSLSATIYGDFEFDQ